MAEERKLVTVLFADVTGSTALGEALDPEDVRALMGRYFQHAQEVIPAHGGALEKFIGDAVMAVFGLPKAHGNDAERALAAALALRAAIEGDALLAGRLVLRIGLNTGEVVATTDPARGEFLVTGDAVNVASRLQAAATPGEILASERTKEAADAAMRFGQARQIEVKGKRQPLRVYTLKGPRHTRKMGRPPLVGRSSDLAQLALLRDRALEERRPQLVSVIAPAGTGKTRLLLEFLEQTPAAAGWRVATARCLPYGQALTFWPLRGMLTELLGAEFTSERVAAALAASGHAPEEAERLAGLVLATLGVESEGATEREQTYHAWRALLEALARTAPRIIVFEDLHWASESLLDLVEYVMSPRTQAALLIISTSRPELLDHRPAWGGGRRSFTALTLDPLSESQTHELVRALARKLPEAARAQIVERAGGNPFFAIELTRTAAERLGADQDHATLPDTVHEAVLARLDLLDPREKAVLQAAAVAGRTFRAETLRPLVGETSAGGVSVALDELLARDLIMPVEAEANTYVFRHILIRDIAYGALARGERIRMHAAAAAWLTEFAAGRLDEFAELIAYHYREAALLARQSAVPITLPFDLSVAIESLERAGASMGRIGASLEGRRHYEAAIAIAPPEDHPRLYEALGDCVMYGEAALAAYEAALARWRARSNADGPITGARLLRKSLIVRTRYQGSIAKRLSEAEMEAMRTDARELAEAAGDDDERWRVRMVDLFWPFWHRSITPALVKEGRQLGQEAAAYFEARGQWEALSEALDGLQSVLSLSGAYREAADVSRRRLELANLSTFERCDASAMLTKALGDVGDYDGSIAAARQLVDVIAQGFAPALQGNTAGFGACSALLAGRWSEATALAAALEEAWEALNRDPGLHVLSHGFTARLHIARAREDQAASDRAASALRTLTTSGRQVIARALLSAYGDDDGRPLNDPALFQPDNRPLYDVFAVMFLNERGVQCSAATLRAAQEYVASQPAHALLHALAVAEALAAGNDAALAGAVDEAEAQGLIPHAARMRIVLAQRTGDRSHLERARPVLRRLDDRQFLGRLEEVASALG